MMVRTCLLITDDPDDYFEYSEAMYEVAEDSVVLMVSDVAKATDLLLLRRCIPELVLLSTNIAGLRPEFLFETLAQLPEFSHVRVVGFGEHPEVLEAFKGQVFAFGPTAMGYSELKEFLSRLI